jgi:hypothetical protein
MSNNAKSITTDLTSSILQNCKALEDQLIDSGVDYKFSRLISIQAAYNSFKALVGGINDKTTQEEIFKAIENDAKNLVFPRETNVDIIGHA